jgi:hypothetical protein
MRSSIAALICSISLAVVRSAQAGSTSLLAPLILLRLKRR